MTNKNTRTRILDKREAPMNAKSV